MTVALMVIDDGREDYLARCLESLAPTIPLFSDFLLVRDPEHQLGFAGAIQNGWDRFLQTRADYLFHVESDFTFVEQPDLDGMRLVLDCSPPGLAQVALIRQPWNDQEKAAGGIVQTDPDSFEPSSTFDIPWLRHRRCFTTNPCLYPRRIVERGWPQQKHSEGVFTHALLADGYEFAFYGAKGDPPRVYHIGEHRKGHGY